MPAPDARRQPLLRILIRQKVQSKLAETRETVWIFVEIAEHVVVLGTEIVVASVIGQNQRIEEEAVSVGWRFAKRRSGVYGPASPFQSRAAIGTSPDPRVGE